MSVPGPRHVSSLLFLIGGLFLTCCQRDNGANREIVLITLDTFRDDHVDPRATPELTTLAARGVRFVQAITSVPLTVPAHASMLTGKSPFEHGLWRNGEHLEQTTIVPRLRRSGRHTAAFLSAYVLNADTGLDIGFDVYDSPPSPRKKLHVKTGTSRRGAFPPGQRPGDQTIEKALTWWQRTPPPRFLWVHLYEPHAPYEPPAEYRPTPDQIHAAEMRAIMSRTGVARPAPLRRGKSPKETFAEQQLLYAGEIRWTDALVGRVLRAVGDSPLVIVAGDHGEALGERDGKFGHGHTLFDEALRIPLIIRWPDGPGGHEVTAPVSVEDLAATILGGADLVPPTQDHLRQLALAHRTAPGRDGIVSACNGQHGQGGLVVTHHPGRRALHQRRAASQTPMVSFRTPASKVIVAPGRQPVLYDLIRDPDELRPRTSAAAMRKRSQLLQSLLEQIPPPNEDSDLELLRVLGYTE
ncbi:sulfatase-like hydrolase/transferase [Myxococcota bacterium]